MRSWENATVDMCIGNHDPFAERKNEFLYNIYQKGEPKYEEEYWINPDEGSHYYLFNNLTELCEMLIKGTKGIVQVGIIKRLLASRDIGLQVHKQSDGVLVTNICYGKKKDRLFLDDSFTKEIYVNAKKLVNCDEPKSIFIELGFNYISSFEDAITVGRNIPFISRVFTDEFGRKCGKILHSDIEPGFYDVQYYIWHKLSEKDKKIYRCPNQWHEVPEKYSDVCKKIVSLLSGIGALSGGSMYMVKDECGNAVMVDSVTSGTKLAGGLNDKGQFRIMHGSGSVESDRIIENVIMLVSELPLVHSIKWENPVSSDSKVYMTRSWEEGAMDLWVRS